MEIFELRYFLGVARHENIHRASEMLRVSPGSLSKAISRIEEELGVKLFSREGRNIRLTEQGKLLRLRASQIVQLEEAARVEIAGHEGELTAVIAGPEVLLSKFGLEVARTIKKAQPRAVIEYQSCTEERALEMVAQGEAHLAVVTSDVPPGLTSRSLGDAHFQTVVGRGHPLHAKARAGKQVPIDEVLKHSFASPNRALLGQVGARQSLDGWRDDQFPRRVEYLSSSLKILEETVSSGAALAYLPDYFLERLEGVAVLKVTGCPYACVQKLRLVARRPQELGWLNRMF